MKKALVVSIKPEFAERIIAGDKTIELRKSAPRVNSGDMMIVYCTFPVMAFVGYCTVKDVLKLEPSVMWKKYSKELGIDRSRFLAYFSDCRVAIGIVISDFRKLDRIVDLEHVKSHLPTFHPPQTFCYLDNEIFEKLFGMDIC